MIERLIDSRLLHRGGGGDRAVWGVVRNGIQGVAEDRMSDVKHVYSQLMSPIIEEDSIEIEIEGVMR